MGMFHTAEDGSAGAHCSALPGEALCSRVTGQVTAGMVALRLAELGSSGCDFMTRV